MIHAGQTAQPLLLGALVGQLLGVDRAATKP